MTQFLPPNLLALFAPREPIPFLPPADKLPHEKKNVHNYVGLAAFVDAAGFEHPDDTPDPVKVERREERLERKKREKEEQVAYKLEQEIALWDPASNSLATTDPFKTLFVGRISYYTSESKIRREFESFGSIKSINMVTNSRTGKARGYCFIEYEHERDMHSAYKHADGMKIDGRRVMVDVERARTVKGWLPRRLGGGIGGTRRGGNDVNVRHSGREDGGGGARHRSRSRDRERRRSRSRDRVRRRRSRSRSRDRKRNRRSRSRDRKRSRSRDKKRSRRSRSRSKDRGSRKDRDRDRDRGRNRGEGEPGFGGVRVKEEPDDRAGDGYNDYYGTNIKQEGEDMEDQKPVLDGNTGAEYPDDGY